MWPNNWITIDITRSDCVFFKNRKNLLVNEIVRTTSRKILQVSSNLLFEEDNLTAPIILEETEGIEEAVEEECPPIFNFFVLLHQYYIPSIIAIGIFGNILSGMVFMTSHLKLRSSSYYLAALATVDFGFLCDLLLVYLSNETDIELFNRQGWCQWMVYVSSVCSILSVWLTVAFTTERFIAVQYPLQRPHICTVSRAKTIIIILVVIAIVSQTYSFATAGMIPVPSTNKNGNNINLSNATGLNTSTEVKEYCGLRDDYHNTMKAINIIDTFVSLICPVVLIVFMNSMIARNLLMFRQSFLRQGNINEKSRTSSILAITEKAGNSANTALQSGRNTYRASHPLVFGATGNGNHFRVNSNSAEQQPRCIQINSSSRNPLSLRSQQNITKMLLLISTVFILLNLPSYVIRLYVVFCFSLWNETPPGLLWCLQQIFMMLYYTQFSVNFLLYAVCGATFRRCLAKIFTKFLRNFSHYRRTWCRIQCDEPNGQQSSNGIPLSPLRQ